MAKAERRQLTVLFCDLVDSTALSGQLDPEEWREVVQAYQATCATVIQRLDGHIAQYLGDGLLVYFGYPQAHEDDAQRAVRAGLGMLQVMQSLTARLVQEQGMRLAVRIGIHTGLVVVGEIGSGGRQEHLALGESPHVVARIQALAAPDTVLMSADTHRLVQGYFVVETLGPKLLKGIAAPLTVYRVLRERAVQSRLDVAWARGLTPLVGRQSEVTLLLEGWEQSTVGKGHVVVLRGEAGIGKSRLVEVLRECLRREDSGRFLWRCSPYHTSSALHPVIEHLQRLLQWQRDDTPETKLAKLEQVLRTYSFPLQEAVPLWATLLSVPLLDRYPPLTLPPQRQRQQTFEALVAWLLAEAERQPVLAVWEDLHWADPSTLELLSLVIDQAPTAPMLILVTCRPEFRSPWATGSHLTEVTLSRLSRPQVETMILHLTGGKALPAEVVAQIVAKTDGVPLFVEELTKMVLDSGFVREAQDRYVLTGPLPALAIPTTLQDSLMARLDRLGPSRDLAQLGAVLGRECTYEVLRAVAPLDEATLQRELSHLVNSELLYQRGLPPQTSYRFKHALVQEAAYQSLLKHTRQQYHRQIAQVLETHFPETAETQPELLAHHYTQADLYEQALAFWKQAGERALGRSAYREAVACFEQALGAVQHLPANRETREQAIDLRFALRTALQPSGVLGRILEVLREAETLAASLEDLQRLGQVALFMTMHFFLVGDPDRAVTAGQRVLTLGTASGNIGLQAVTNTYLGLAYNARGEYQSAIDCLKRTVVALDGALLYERFGQVLLPAVHSRAFMAWCLAEMGRFSEGVAIGEEGRRIAEAVGHPGSLMYAFWGIGLLSLRQGNLPQALPWLERAVSICQDRDLWLYFPAIVSSLGLAYALDGRIADGLPLLEQAVEQSTSMGRLGHQAHFVGMLGEGLLWASRLEEARHHAGQAIELAHVHKERGHEAWALRLLGESHAHPDPPEVEPAEASYHQALALADELGMRPLQAHCHLGLGTLYAKISRPEQARAELSTAIALYHAMDITFWLPQAEAVLAQVEGR
jgi:class 3 adenylate cyclase/tetratricopeptide (TPR) repeat protein